MRRAMPRPRMLLLFLLCASLACSPPPEQQDGAIIAGTRDSQDPAVVAIVRDGSPHCTGTLVAPDAILTAAHCVSSWSLDDLAVLFASSVREPEADAVTIRPREAWVP